MNKFTAISSIVSVMLSVCLIVTMIVFSSHAKHSVINEVKMYMEIWIYLLDITLIKNKLMDKSLLQNIKEQKILNTCQKC